MQCCRSTRGSAGRSILLVGILEHCTSQRSSIRSCSHIAAESRSRVLRWWPWYVLPCLFSYLCVLCCAGWRMGWLSERRLVLLIACASLMPCAAGSGNSNAVDIFNVTSGAWSTANLSVARRDLAATSLPNHGVAIFAGGAGTCCHVDFRIFACCFCAGWGMGCLIGRRLDC